MKRLIMFVSMLAALLVLGGCGGDESDTDAQLAAGDRPEAKESLEEFTNVFEDALAKAREGACQDWFSLFTGEPALTCDQLSETLKDDPMTVEGTDQFTVEGTDEPAPAAVLETTAKAEGESTWALAADYDGNWRIINQFVPAPGDQPLDPAETDEVAETYVGAIRDQDCERYLETVLLAPQDTEQAVCASLDEGPLAEAFQTTNTEVEALGGNESIRFYGLSLEEEGWFNFLILDQRGDPTVLATYWVTHPDSPSATEPEEGSEGSEDAADE